MELRKIAPEDVTEEFASAIQDLFRRFYPPGYDPPGCKPEDALEMLDSVGKMSRECIAKMLEEGHVLFIAEETKKRIDKTLDDNSEPEKEIAGFLLCNVYQPEGVPGTKYGHLEWLIMNCTKYGGCGNASLLHNAFIDHVTASTLDGDERVLLVLNVHSENAKAIEIYTKWDYLKDMPEGLPPPPDLFKGEISMHKVHREKA